MSSSFVKGFRSARGFNSAICWQAATPPAARPGTAVAADPSRTAATDGVAIQRIRSPGTQARQAAGRAQIIPFGCTAGRQPPTATLAPNDGSGEVFPPCSVTQRREFTRLGSSWPVVISPAEWLLLAGRLSRDSGAYSVTTWVTRRPDGGRLGKEIGSWLRSFRVGHVAQAAADPDWCAQGCLTACPGRGSVGEGPDRAWAHQARPGAASFSPLRRGVTGAARGGPRRSPASRSRSPAAMAPGPRADAARSRQSQC